MTSTVMAIAKKMFRLIETCFCQQTIMSRERQPIDARRRDRYRFWNRDIKDIFEVDTDTEPDTDSDDSVMLAFVYRHSKKTEF